MALRLFLYDRWENMIGEVMASSATNRQVLNGDDTLSFEAQVVLSDNDRVLWDDGGLWREHIVNGSDQEHSGGETCKYVSEASFIWDLGHKHIRYARWENVTAAEALANVLDLVPLWDVGEVDETDPQTIELAKKSVYEALGDLMELYGLESEPVIEVDKNGITARKINLKEQIGRDSGVRIDYGHGLDGITKEVLEDYFYTACYGYGKSSGSGANSQMWCYVVNEEAAKIWGVSDGQGGIDHLQGVYENSQCESLQQLEEETKEYLNDHSAPAISYRIDSPTLSLRGVRNGDTLEVVDKDFSPPLRLVPRMTEMTRNLITGEVTSATFGTVTSIVPDILARSYESVSNAQSEIYALGTKISDVNSKVEDVEAKQGDIGDVPISEQLSDLDGRIKALENKQEAIDGNG